MAKWFGRKSKMKFLNFQFAILLYLDVSGIAESEFNLSIAGRVGLTSRYKILYTRCEVLVGSRIG
jgi:hypothetical protein